VLTASEPKPETLLPVMTPGMAGMSEWQPPGAGVKCLLPDAVAGDATDTWKDIKSRLGVKATTLKAKAKDLAFKAKANAKDLAFKAKAKAKNLASKAKAGRCQGQCQYDSLFSQNFITQTFIAGLVMTNFILIARFSKLVIKLTVSFSQRTLKYFRPSICFPRPRPRT